MSNQKKTSGNLSSKACLLNTHTSLVFAASEERKVYESLLKLVIERINGKNIFIFWFITFLKMFLTYGGIILNNGGIISKLKSKYLIYLNNLYTIDLFHF